MTALVFASTSALERTLDGTDEAYERYFFALYHCSPDEDAGINEYRRQLHANHPGKAMQVGRHFVLCGEPAAQALRSYYYALSQAESVPEEHRSYARRRQQEIEKLHASSQTLPKPIDLSEGQLAEDKALDFYACLALSGGQVLCRVASK